MIFERGYYNNLSVWWSADGVSVNSWHFTGRKQKQVKPVENLQGRLYKYVLIKSQMSLSEESTIDETLCTFAKYFIWSPILIVAGKCEFAGQISRCISRTSILRVTMLVYMYQDTSLSKLNLLMITDYAQLFSKIKSKVWTCVRIHKTRTNA